MDFKGVMKAELKRMNKHMAASESQIDRMVAEISSLKSENQALYAKSISAQRDTTRHKSLKIRLEQENKGSRRS
jgi:septal ring factor EnvC (AmiA/AmiB activator)